MGLKNPFQKKEQGSPAPSDAPPYTGSEKSTYDEEYGHNTNITTGWTGDGFAGANEYPRQPEEGLGDEYRTLGRWRACVILITIEVGIGVLSLPSALKTLGLIPGIIAILGFGSLTT